MSAPRSIVDELAARLGETRAEFKQRVANLVAQHGGKYAVNLLGEIETIKVALAAAAAGKATEEQLGRLDSPRWRAAIYRPDGEPRTWGGGLLALAKLDGKKPRKRWKPPKPPARPVAAKPATPAPRPAVAMPRERPRIRRDWDRPPPPVSFRRR